MPKIGIFTHVDPGPSVLADLDTGRQVHTARRGIRSFDLDGVVVGFDHTITPGRIATAIHTATTTPTY